MEYAILRIQKLKSAGGVRNSLKHAFREQETPNADQERTPNNTHIGAQDSLQAIKKFNAGLPLAVRKNAVLALEYLITGSPEAMAQKTETEQNAYFNDALKYLHATYGKENVFYAGVHRDETTPHLYAYVLPIKDGKLNARHFIGGHKDRMSEMQTEFAETVGRKHALERGVKGSRARHQEIKRYYAKVNEKTPLIASVSIPERSVFEKQDEYSKRVLVEVNKAVAPRLNAFASKAKAADDAIERARVAELAKKQAETKLLSVSNELKQSMENLNVVRKNTKVLLETIAKGGESLEYLQKQLNETREQKAQEAERKNDDGMSR